MMDPHAAAAGTSLIALTRRDETRRDGTGRDGGGVFGSEAATHSIWDLSKWQGRRVSTFNHTTHKQANRRMRVLSEYPLMS